MSSNNHKWLPTLSELTGMLSIHLLKEIFITMDKENYSK